MNPDDNTKDENRLELLKILRRIAREEGYKALINANDAELLEAFEKNIFKRGLKVRGTGQ